MGGHERPGQPCLSPDEKSHYLYFVLPAEFLARAADGIWLDFEYFGERHAEFRVQYASKDKGAPLDGLYKPAEQRWNGDAAGLKRFRRALFPLPNFDPGRTQNQGASFRVEFRREVLVSRVAVTLAPLGLRAFPVVAPLPELRRCRAASTHQLPLHRDHHAQLQVHLVPRHIMGRRRGS